MSAFGDVKWWEWILPPVALHHAAINWAKSRLKPKIPGYQEQRQQTSCEGVPIPILYGTARIGGNIIWAKPPVALGDGKFGVPMIVALCEGPIDSITAIWNDKGRAVLPVGTYTLKTGERSQAVWDWLTTNYASEAIPYGGLALLCMEAFRSDAGGNFNALTWAVKGKLAAYSGDAHPADIVQDLLTDREYGAAWPSSRLASMAIGQDGLAASSFDTYCHAMGFYISLLIGEQQSYLDVLAEILAATNSAAIRSGAQIKILPLGDTSVTGNGHTFTPSNTICAELDESDFLVSGDEDPIRVTIRAQRDTFNDFPIEYTDKAGDYDVRTVNDPEPSDVQRFGKRTASLLQLHAITRGEHATAISRILAQNSINVRRNFTFKLPLRHIRLEPLDLVSLSCNRLWLTDAVVRIVSIDEIDFEGDRAFEVVAEEWKLGIGHAVGYLPQASGGTITDYDADPGNAAAPVLAQAPAAYVGGKQRLFIATSGGADWGGCEVWTSWDDSMYTFQGTIRQASAHGTLHSTFASGADPDITNTLAVDLVNGGTLATASVVERDALTTLCYVDGEWVSYAAAALVAGTYNLTSLRRGVFLKSAIGSHSSGTKFARIAPATFRLEIDSAKFGSTLYVKLLSFNKWGGGKQALAAVSAATVVLINCEAGTPWGAGTRDQALQEMAAVNLTPYPIANAYMKAVHECQPATVGTYTGRLIVVTNAGDSHYSDSTGQKWTAGGTTTGTWQALAGADISGTYRVVAVGYNGTTPIISTSDDGGATWTPRTTNAPGTSLRHVIWDGSKFVAVGYGGTCVTSADGITWTARTMPGSVNWWKVAAGGGKYVAFGTAGQIATSTNGTTWAGQSDLPGTNPVPADMAYGQFKFVIVGNTGTSPQTMTTWRSVDGVSWDSSTSPVTSGQIYAVRYNGTIFLAVGTLPTPNRAEVYVSIDGVTWDMYGLRLAAYFYDVIWATGLSGDLGAWVYVGQRWSGLGDSDCAVSDVFRG